MAALSEWLQIMLAEIARKREDLEHAREEEAKRVGETRPRTEQQPEREARAVRH
ncbi:MAG: hypothetical protein JWN85_5009 [Gammaproteobacteria bacterium]|nr:hypothetical protein [Gammaproteobacteria bacterium]